MVQSHQLVTRFSSKINVSSFQIYISTLVASQEGILFFFGESSTFGELTVILEKFPTLNGWRIWITFRTEDSLGISLKNKTEPSCVSHVAYESYCMTHILYDSCTARLWLIYDSYLSASVQDSLKGHSTAFGNLDIQANEDLIVSLRIILIMTS